MFRTNILKLLKHILLPLTGGGAIHTCLEIHFTSKGVWVCGGGCVCAFVFTDDRGLWVHACVLKKKQTLPTEDVHSHRTLAESVIQRIFAYGVGSSMVDVIPSRWLNVRSVHVWMVNVCVCGSTVVDEMFTKMCRSSIVGAHWYLLPYGDMYEYSTTLWRHISLWRLKSLFHRKYWWNELFIIHKARLFARSLHKVP